MKSYIIKNCPALRFKLIPLKENPICSKMPFEECCKDITDCTLKRIVNKCRNELEKRNAYSVSIHYDFAIEILKFVEIEECE